MVIPSFVPPPVLFLFATEVLVQLAQLFAHLSQVVVHIPQVLSHLPQPFSLLGALGSLLALSACHDGSTSLSVRRMSALLMLATRSFPLLSMLCRM
jgi:hypothetical protein